MKPLAIIPTFLREQSEAVVLAACVRTLAKTLGEVDVLIVDDGSPAVELLDVVDGEDVEVIRQPSNEGFSRTVNVGLRRALEQGRDAILVNADVEFPDPYWLKAMLATENLHQSGPAWVVGALLTYPNGLIQHGGIYLSKLTRTFGHFWRYAPRNLPEAQLARACPVTGALQLIRHEALTTVGLYDEDFRMGYEDVDYCLRTFLAGGECVYNPRVRARHHESLFRGRSSPQILEWQHQSFFLLLEKYREHNLVGLCPTW